MNALAACLSISLHLMSLHFGGGDYNERNYGAGLNCNKFHAGAFRNSLGRISTYAGKSHTWCRGRICAGGALLFVTGYEIEPVIAPVPIVSVGDAWRLNIIALPSVAGFTGFVGFGLEVPVRIGGAM